MNILITNDDGINAPGIITLTETLKKIATVTVIAPYSEQSGSSQSITIHDPIKFKHIFHNGVFLGYGVKGSPADCVKLGLFDLLDVKPDFVVSGINRGPNNAVNILYSGTVGGAFEGAVNGIPSIAVSLASFHYENYSISADFAKDFILFLNKIGPNKKTVYNVNVPPLAKEEIKGVRFTQMSHTVYLLNYEKRKDPFGEPYYWLSDFRLPETQDKDTDDWALSNTCISITPLQVDRTDYNELNKLKQFNGEFWSRK